MSTVELNLKGLDALIKALGEKPPQIKIGVLGGSKRDNGKQKNGPTNAEVGAFHEFGTSTLPVRSFLRVPLMENLQPALERAGAFDVDSIREVLKAGSLSAWARIVAITAEGVVLGAFDTGGYGRWPPSDMRYKKNAQTLVETNQLRNAITTEVK